MEVIVITVFNGKDNVFSIFVFDISNYISFTPFLSLIAPVGCPNCSGIGFCSYECMTEACSTYHKYECQFLDLFIGKFTITIKICLYLFCIFKL